MIALVVVGHNGVPASLVSALEQGAGPQESVAAICILADDDMEQRRDEILELVPLVTPVYASDAGHWIR